MKFLYVWLLIIQLALGMLMFSVFANPNFYKLGVSSWLVILFGTTGYIYFGVPSLYKLYKKIFNKE